MELVWVHDAADTIFQQITVQPGGFTGWHSHPGPALVTVAQGTLAYYDGEDESCTDIEYGPGESFVDIVPCPQRPERGTNRGQPCVMYLYVPPGVASPFIAAEDPGCAPSERRGVPGYRASPRSQTSSGIGSRRP